MSGTSGVDPLHGRIEQLQHALTTETGHAEGANGRLSIDCTADGMIRNWHVDDVLLRGGDPRAVITALIGLQQNAVEQAREGVRDRTDSLRADPRFSGITDTYEDTLNQPPKPAVRQQDEPDDYQRTRIFETPVGRARRPH